MKKFLSVPFAAVLLSSGFFASIPHTVHASTPSPAVSYTQSIEQSNSYNMVRDALLENKQFGQFDPTEISTKEVGALVSKVLRENPEVLYYHSATMWKSGKLEFVYHHPAEVIKENRQLLDQEIDRVLDEIIEPDFTDFDKVKAIHDYLVLHIAYDYDNFENKTVPADSYTAYGAMILGSAVCDGYTKAAQIMLDRLGIENNYIIGSVNGNAHSWNQVKLDGHYYFMDITWDDPAPNKPGVVNYNYFLTTSEQLKKDHSWDEERWPVATNKKYSYFHESRSVSEVDNIYYYSNMSDNDRLYQISTNGKNKKKISNLRAPYLAVSGDWIYFSNYSSGGHLYKMKKDGSKLQKLNSIHSIDIMIDGKTLHFTDHKTKKKMKLAIK